MSRNNWFIQEVRGVMTRFEPLSEAAISACTKDGIHYTELADKLTALGLDPRKVVHDPTRRYLNTFYADYDRALYSHLFLERQNFDASLLLLSKAKCGINLLNCGQWKTYYLKCVPLPMMIYDFQRRYMDIPQEDVFSVWYDIHKQIDYANGMWRQDVLNYVFDHAPGSDSPPPLGEDGLVTLYRGMGKLSQPPETAVSWSTHPGNALWFAIRSGFGTHIAVAKVPPEYIVAYSSTFYHENEILVRPGTVTSYRYEDMIPAEYELVAPLLAKALPDYMLYGPLVQKLGYREERIPLVEIHGLHHILRVLLLSLIYYYNSGDALTDADRQVLIYFSLLHDIGRTSELRDDGHGEASVKLIQSRGIRLKGIRLAKKDYRIAELLIRHHCHDDQDGIAAILSQPDLTRKDRERAVHLYEICKDMDGLDRVRFNGLDYRMLRTEYGRRLPLVAGALLSEDMLEVLRQ